MKKILSATLAGAMLLSAMPHAFAKNNEMEDILRTVKERIEVPAELEDFESSSYEDKEEGITVYNFAWSDDDGDNLSVNCRSDKIISSYNSYTNDKEMEYSNELAFSKDDREEVRKKAQAFIDKINPDSGIVVEEGENTLRQNGFYFNLTRERNGIPVNGDYGSIRFDKDNENVENFFISWSTVNEFEGENTSDFAIKTDAEAHKAFDEKLGFELVYRSYAKDKEIIFYPAYVQKNSGKYLDAVTGEVIEPMQKNIWRYAAGKGGAAMESANDMAFTPAEQAELDKVSGLIDKSKAEKTVRENPIISVDGDYELNNIWLGRDYYDSDSYTYSMYFSNGDKYVSATVDAVTGDIYGIDKSAMHSERADEAAMKNALEKLAPSVSAKYAFDGENMSRYENGIRVLGDSSCVWLDEDGEAVSFNVNFTKKAQFPSIENAISYEEASEKIFDAVDYTTKYFPQEDKKAYLAYGFDSDVNLNAVTGKIVGYDNEEIEDNSYTYSDIDGHYAKEMIEKLAEYNIGFNGGKFLPDENITEHDFRELMSKIFYNIILYNKNAEDISDENAPITRERAAVLMIEAMGAGDWAKYEDIYTKPFADVDEFKGYVSLLSAMGVVKGDENGNFNPKNHLTRAQAAVMAYNYLNK